METPKIVVFVVKRYAVREAEKWRYAVRKAKIGRYAVRKGEGGVTLIDNNRITKSEQLFLNFNYTSELYRSLIQTNYFRVIVNNIYNEYTTTDICKGK